MGWLPSSAQSGRPEQLVRPSADQLATAPYTAPTAATQSSQYAAGAGTINGQSVTSGASVGGSTGSSGVLAAPVVPPAEEPRVASRGRDETLKREREEERAHYKETVRKQAAAPVCKSCGIVESVNEVKTRAQGSGMGAAGGAVVGGLLGRQVGDGRGRDLATIAGAIGGAVVGNQVEGNMKATKRYDVTVRMHDGELRTFHTDSPVWRGGDQVKVVNGQLQSR
ncbi:glycine zipper 2TM domain-containing protein [Pseudoduganella flava]|nr:glycine zipper 2TM domain-containing protein [Pseudoduganella flava]